jgi:hypothetical protein
MAVFHLIWIRRSWLVIMIIKSSYNELAFSSNIGFAVYQCPFGASPCFIAIFHSIMKGVSVTFFIFDWTTWTAASNRQNQLLGPKFTQQKLFQLFFYYLQGVYLLKFGYIRTAIIHGDILGDLTRQDSHGYVHRFVVLSNLLEFEHKLYIYICFFVCYTSMFSFHLSKH